MNLRPTHTSVLIFLFVSLVSCEMLFEDPVPNIQDARIIGESQDRLKKYRLEKLINCRERIISDAEVHIDTTLSKIIFQYLQDTIYFPNRPQRPELPDRIPTDTSLLPVPLFPKDALPPDSALKDSSIILPDSILKIIKGQYHN